MDQSSFGSTRGSYTIFRPVVLMLSATFRAELRFRFVRILGNCTSNNSRNAQTYLIHILKGIDDVIGQARQQVDDEPSLQIVHPNEFGVRDHLSTGPHEGGVEVENDIHQEDDVNYAV